MVVMMKVKVVVSLRNLCECQVIQGHQVGYEWYILNASGQGIHGHTHDLHAHQLHTQGVNMEGLKEMGFFTPHFTSTGFIF